MKYRDLIHFKPITEVVRFGDLRDEKKRQQFVETFVNVLSISADAKSLSLHQNTDVAPLNT